MSPDQVIVTHDRNRFGNGAELPDRSKGLVVVVALSLDPPIGSLGVGFGWCLVGSV